MPHTTDRYRCAARRARTGEPVSLARRGLPRRDALLETLPGQQALQSVLLQIFAYPEPEHPWNPSGRTLTELYDCYGGFVSPQPDRIVIGSSCAHRMSAYLLPYTSHKPGRSRCAGVPGLRLAAVSRHGYELHHLPTGTVVEILDGRRGSIQQLHLELRRRAKAGHTAAWQSGELTAEERALGGAWRVTAHTALYAAWFHAVPLFDNHCGARHARHAALHPARHDGTRAVLQWCGTLTPREAVEHLQALQIGVDGQPLNLTSPTDNFGILQAGDAGMELHQRPACMRCNRSFERWDEHDAA